MISPKKVGEGSYGCVHNPPLKCKNKPYNPDLNKVSKILTRKHANSELKEFKLIQDADKKEDFHLGKPGSCFPDTNLDNKFGIDECNRFDSNDIDKYKLLLLKNGGKDLSAIEYKLSSLKPNAANRRILEHFWLDMSRIIYGSKVLISNGIVHHDLKQQNIVYNEETGRVNFIDFGLMTTTKKMIKDATGSRYRYGAHWSFPPEVALYNYIKYNKLTRNESQSRKVDIMDVFKPYTDIFNHVKYYMVETDREDAHHFKKRSGIDFYNMCIQLKKGDSEYNDFLKRSFETFDNFAIGFSLFSILKNTKFGIDKKLKNDLRELFKSMMHFNVFERPSPSDVVDKYETILKSNGLLDKYQMRFEDHLLVDGTEQKHEEKQIEDLPKSVKKFIDELVLKCPDGKEYNPITKRCIIKCPDGKERNPKTKRCINKYNKNKTQKNKLDPERTITDPVQIIHSTVRKNSSVKKVCAKGKEYNPKTKRCKINCKDGYSRDKEFNCKKDKK